VLHVHVPRPITNEQFVIVSINSQRYELRRNILEFIAFAFVLPSI